MKEVELKKNKHLLVLEIPAGYSPGHVEELSVQIKRMVGELSVLILQPETKVTLLKLED